MPACKEKNLYLTSGGTSHRPYISNLARSAVLECASTTIARG